MINRKYAKTPPSWKCQDDKVGIFDDAVLGMAWARCPVDRPHVYMKSSEDLHRPLSNSLQKDVKEARSTEAAKSATMVKMTFHTPLHVANTRLWGETGP